MADKSLWSEGNLMWMAGLLEGEGWFRYIEDPIKSYYGLEIGCSMTDEDVINKLKLLAGFGRIYAYASRKINAKEQLAGWVTVRKPIWSWRASAMQDVIDLELAILPLMGIRRQQQIVSSHEKRAEFERNYVTSTRGRIRRYFT